MMLIAIDGSSRRNGKPDCTASGMAYCEEVGKFFAFTDEESTNQRGEILGALAGLRLASSIAFERGVESFNIVTDSEYVFNTIHKDWTFSWANKGWVTSSGNPVKNRDLWEAVYKLLVDFSERNIEVNMVHIKGHVVSIGKVTARKLLEADSTGAMLRAAAGNKYDVMREDHIDRHTKAHELFKRNMGYMVAEEVFRKLVIANTVADYGASIYLDKHEEKKCSLSQ